MRLTLLALVGGFLLLDAGSSQAALQRDKVFVADAKKNQAYVKDGLITGGDQAVAEVTVRDIRRATNAGFERIVIDLEGARNGEPIALQRPPYYQIAVTPDEKRVVMTLWGSPKLAFVAPKVVSAFKKSSVIESVQLLPRVEDETWTIVFALKSDRPIEVFELTNPARIIMDIRTEQRKRGG